MCVCVCVKWSGGGGGARSLWRLARWAVGGVVGDRRRRERERESLPLCVVRPFRRLYRYHDQDNKTKKSLPMQTLEAHRFFESVGVVEGKKNSFVHAQWLNAFAVLCHKYNIGAAVEPAFLSRSLVWCWE